VIENENGHEKFKMAHISDANLPYNYLAFSYIYAL
jgi:hypothetical protein